MNVPFVDLHAQYLSIQAEIDCAIQKVIFDSAFIGGRYVKAFELHFAEYLGVNHCIGVANGTDALVIAMNALGIGPGDEVITVANSFIATSEAITKIGAKVVFVDCLEGTLLLNPNKLEEKITNKTRAVIPVHLYGQPADMQAIIDIAKAYRLFVIEDAAQAHGALYREQKIGTLGDCACFSFYPGKNLGAYGDAGAVVTNDDNLAKKVRMYANHGRVEKYNHEFEGINSRLDGLQAAILDAKLPHLEAWNARRRDIAQRYDEAFRECNRMVLPLTSSDVRHVYHLYVIRIPQRDTVRAQLAECGISTGIHYPIPLPFLKAYEYLGHQPEDFPVTYTCKNELLSLPIHGSMSNEQVDYVIERVNSILKGLKQ